MIEMEQGRHTIEMEPEHHMIEMEPEHYMIEMEPERRKIEMERRTIEMELLLLDETGLPECLVQCDLNKGKQCVRIRMENGRAHPLPS